MNTQWRNGNRVRLLENGEAFFPRVFEAIAAAEREVILETFILFEDKVGTELHQVLIAAARRGVQVEVTVDGYGSPDLSPEFVGALAEAGVRLHVFDPRPKLLGMRTNVFRRLHRKLLVVDGRLAFVGGINFSAEHLADYGPQAKQDYAVEVEGLVVADIHRFCRAALLPARAGHWWLRVGAPQQDLPAPAEVGSAQVGFVVRDNDAHRDDIERQYRVAIRAARRELIIANAYFFPGYRLLHELSKAARRGVQVSLILQGKPDWPLAMSAARQLYHYLICSGVRIYEYCERPLHGKVALADGEWATVGSSNLEPLSLSLNLEANVFIRDREFNRRLREHLLDAVLRNCRPVGPDQIQRRTLWRTIGGFFVFHFLRHFPSWAGLVPGHTPHLALMQPPKRKPQPEPPG